MRNVGTQSAYRQAIVSALLDAVGSDHATLVVQLVATAFASRVVDAQFGRGALQLANWVGTSCERYGSYHGVSTLLVSACSTASRILRRNDALAPWLERDLETLHDVIERQLIRFTLAEPENPHTINDNIDAAIATFLVTLDLADPLSAEHSRAVSLWSRRLSKRMNLSEAQATFVSRGGLLHDVGKSRTPTAILTAPRALTMEEFAVMRDHASLGAAMVHELDELRPFAPIVANHHERPDGKGYPQGLTAPEISLDVRIVTVADCFNAMIGRRPYRPPLSPAAALEQLVKHQETQFDPIVVEAMIDIVEHPDE